MSDSERDKIINRAKKIRADILQSFTDAESWNENSDARKNGADPIDPDPYGELRRLLASIDEMLANDKGFGPIATLTFERSH